MINIIISGIGGRMGKEVVESAEKNEKCHLLGGIRDTDNFLKEQIKKAVIIDFSSKEAMRTALFKALKYKIPIVIGTTALSDEELLEIRKASKSIPVFLSFNMSRGICLLEKMLGENSELLNQSYDIQIIEIHHRNKKDAPSGTAIELARALKRDNIASLRLGSVKGCHVIILSGEGETIEIRHTASDRAVFAQGAVEAALFISRKKPGLYSMRDMLEGGEEK